jgi:hypothetical protein
MMSKRRRERTTAELLRAWKQSTSPYDGFLLSLTSGEIEAVSRVTCKDGHPQQQEALAFLKALYATD